MNRRAIVDTFYPHMKELHCRTGIATLVSVGVPREIYERIWAECCTLPNALLKPPLRIEIAPNLWLFEDRR